MPFLKKPSRHDFSIFNTLDLLQQLNLFKYKNESLQRHKFIQYLLISTFSNIDTIVSQLCLISNLSEIRVGKKKWQQDHRQAKLPFFLHCWSTKMPPGQKQKKQSKNTHTHFKARYVNTALKKPVACNFFWFCQGYKSLCQDFRFQLHFIDLRYIPSTLLICMNTLYY